eukprot:TRINITY_DN10820_c0_g1_i1.p1 TRINITY_DN10820_c0_g1~~TRINITY_DN10820_c0_g1_i1.p1  ORF type:complete len:459 (+),score=65.75 TRINITY_DN10820_c0_g1_i1:186-1379(+)
MDAREPYMATSPNESVEHLCDHLNIVVVMHVEPSRAAEARRSVYTVRRACRQARFLLRVEPPAWEHMMDLNSPYISVIMRSAEESMLLDLAAASSLGGLDCTIVHASPEVHLESFWQLLSSSEAAWPGTSLGSRAISYRGMQPIFATPALYAPGSIDASFFGEYRELEVYSPCRGAEELLLRAHLSARGVLGLNIELTRAQDVLPEKSAWDRCFEFLWVRLGRRHLTSIQHRVALFVAFPPSFIIQRVAPKAADLAQELTDHDIQLLSSQDMSPSVVYHFVKGSRKASLSAEDGARVQDHRWIGGVDGFEIRALPCGSCGVKDMIAAAVRVERLPTSLLVFASVERLVNNQLVSDNVLCAEQALRTPEQVEGFCGYALGDGRIKEFSVLRVQLAGEQ